MIVYVFSSEKVSTAVRDKYVALCSCTPSEVQVEEGAQAAMRATAKARARVREGSQVILVGKLQDVVSEDAGQSFGEVEWRLAWLEFLESHSIAYVPVGGKKGLDDGEGPAASVVRRYRRAAAALVARLNEVAGDVRRNEGRALGRPPYGYQSVQGRLLEHPQQARNVRLIFGALRKGQIVAEILSELQAKTEEFWDRVKIRRILDHAPLYCRGALTTRLGVQVIQRELAFLPEDWESAAPPRKDPAVPRHKEVGTLEA